MTNFNLQDSKVTVTCYRSTKGCFWAGFQYTLGGAAALSAVLVFIGVSKWLLAVIGGL